MRTTIGTWTCAVLCVCCVSGAASAMVRAEGDLYAGCMVKITADPAVYPLTIDNIGYLIRRTAVGQKPISDLKADIPADDAIVVEPLEPVGGAADPYGGYGAGAGAPMVGMYVGGGGMGGFGGSVPGNAPDLLVTEPKDDGAANLPPEVGARYGSGRGTSAMGYGMGDYGAMGGMGGYGGVYGGYASPYGGGRPAETGEPGAVSLFIHLAVDLRPWPEAPGTSKEVLHAVITNLRKALEDASQQHEEAVARQLGAVDREAARAEKDLIALQASLRELSGSRDLSRRGIQEELRGLRSYLDTSMRERATNAATAEAMAKQLAESRAQVENRMGSDVILQELERMVRMAEEQEAQVYKMVQTGRASAAESTQAAEKTLRARIELAKRKEELGKAGGGGAAILTSEMATLSVKAAQLDAEIMHLQKQVDEAQALLVKADAYERELLKLDLARRNMEEAIVLRDRMARRSRMIVPPAVVVMGAE